MPPWTVREAWEVPAAPEGAALGAAEPSSEPDTSTEVEVAEPMVAPDAQKKIDQANGFKLRSFESSDTRNSDAGGCIAPTIAPVPGTASSAGEPGQDVVQKVSPMLETTKSAQDLEDPGAMIYETRKGVCGTICADICARFHRLNLLQIYKVQLMPWENQDLVEERRLGMRSAQYLVWRRSLLQTGTFFFAGIVAFDVLLLLYSLKANGMDAQYLKQIDERYHKYFYDLRWWNKLNTICLLVASAVAVILAFVASLSWRTMSRSASAVLGSFLCSYLPPFLLLLFIPFRSGVDFTGIQQQVCNDSLGGTWEYMNESGLHMAAALWPAPGDGSLSSLLKEHSDIELPPDFCERDPRTWGYVITDCIRSAGLLQQPGGSCSRVDRAEAKLRRAANTSALRKAGLEESLRESENRSRAPCPEMCSNCTGVCSQHLLPLNALVSTAGDISVIVEVLDTSLVSCIHCVQPSADLQCPQRCPAVGHAILERSLMGELPDPNSVCVDPEKVQDFELLARLATQRSYWEALVGSLFALLSLAQLMPLALSLLMGAAKGSGIAKSVIPYSRLPNIVSASAVIFTFPFVLQLAIVVQTTIGNYFTLVGVCLLLLALTAKMKPSMFESFSQAEMQSREFILDTICKICILASMIMFAVAAWDSELTKIAATMACDQMLCLTPEQRSIAQEQFMYSFFRILCAFLGKSLVATVFFADGVVSLMHFFHFKESNDPIQVQCRRAVLVKDLHGMFGKKVVPFNAVADFDRRNGQETQNKEEEEEEAHAVVPLSALVQIQNMLAERADGAASLLPQASTDDRRDPRRLDFQALLTSVDALRESTNNSIQAMMRIQQEHSSPTHQELEQRSPTRLAVVPRMVMAWRNNFRGERPRVHSSE